MKMTRALSPSAFAALTAVLLTLALFALPGCGGGGGLDDLLGGTVRRSGTLGNSDATLQDGSPYNEWTCEAARDGEVSVEMSSSAVDAYLVVARDAGDGSPTPVAENDDDSGSDAKVTFSATQGERFLVIATAARPAFGSYTLEFDGFRNIGQSRKRGRDAQTARPAKTLPPTAKKF